MIDNPYQAPTAPAAPTGDPSLALYSPRALATCTILFTPFVGALMAARNWQRVGEPTRARNNLFLGIGFAVAVAVLSVVLPDSLSRVVSYGSIGASVAAASAMRKEHAPVYEKHIAEGGAKATPWLIGSIGALLLAMVVVFMIGGYAGP